MGPDYKRPAISLPTYWRVEITEAADVTNTSWWRAFGDEYLDKMIDQALTANADLRIATARVEEFSGKLQTTHSQYFPQLGYDLGFERSQFSQEVPELLRPGQETIFNQFRGLLTISYEFDLWGRVRRSNEAANAELLGTQQARHTVMLTVVTSVASTYIELLATDRELEIARQTLDSLKATWDLMDKKYHGGSATDVQVAVAHAEYLEQMAIIPDVEKRIAFLEDSLSVLLGSNPGPISRGRLENLTLVSVPGGIPASVLTRRPDVQAAEQDLIAANAAIGIAKAEYFPTFPLTASYGQSSDMISSLLNKTARTGDLAVDLIGPVFTFGKVAGDIRAARAVSKEQESRYIQTIQTALQEVNDALVYNQQARRRADVLVEHLSTLQAADALTRLRYQGGSSTDLDVLYADRRVYAAQNEQFGALRDEYLALVSVFKAMGGGWMLEQDKLLTASKNAPKPVGSAAVTPGSQPQAPQK